MSYELKYHTNLCKDLKIPKERKKFVGGLKWIFISILLALGISLLGRDFWMDFLIPGDSEVTAFAMETFAENIHEGTPIDEAFQEFCLEIVNRE